MSVKFCRLTHKTHGEVIYGILAGYVNHDYFILVNGDLAVRTRDDRHWNLEILQICSIDFTQWGMIENE